MLSTYISVAMLLCTAAVVTANPITTPEVHHTLNKRNGEGLHLVNCYVSNGAQVSEMWYYKDDSQANNGFRGSPTDRTEVDNNGFAHWEGQAWSGTFQSGVTFTSHINANAYGQPTGMKAGTGYNGSNWICYNDNGRDLYDVSSSGGANCGSIYYCLKG